VGEDLSFRISTVTEEEKVEESPRREPDLTMSEYSYLSYFESMDKKSREPSRIISRNGSIIESGSGSGVIIKRNFNSSIKEGEEQTEQLSET
jgi:hypothetical protein